MEQPFLLYFHSQLYMTQSNPVSSICTVTQEFNDLHPQALLPLIWYSHHYHHTHGVRCLLPSPWLHLHHPHLTLVHFPRANVEILLNSLIRFCLSTVPRVLATTVLEMGTPPSNALEPHFLLDSASTPITSLCCSCAGHL